MIGKGKLIGTILILLGLQAASFVYAAGGGEQASSPGVSGQKPLHLSSVTLEGGGDVQNAADMPTEPRLILQFDKNVVNSLIWAGNSKCFSLVSADNENIPLSVTKVDDTVDVGQRQTIFVQPERSLSPGTIYYLNISPALKAKNGVTLGEGVSITFKTQGEAPVSPPRSADGTTAIPVNADKPHDSPKQQTVSEIAGQIPAATGPSINVEDKPKEARGVLPGRITTIGILLVAGWICYEIWSKRNRMK